MQPCKAANLPNPSSRCYIPSACESSLNHFRNNSCILNGTNYLARGDKENASTLIHSPLRWSQHAVTSYMLSGGQRPGLKNAYTYLLWKIPSLNWQDCLGYKLCHCKGCCVLPQDKPCWNTDPCPTHKHAIVLHQHCLETIIPTPSPMKGKGCPTP